MNNQLDIKALLKPNVGTATLYDFVHQVDDIQIYEGGAISSSIEELGAVGQRSLELGNLLNSLIKHVALVIGYSLDKYKIDSPICHFYIIHAINTAAQELEVFSKICEQAAKTKTWPTDVSGLPGHSLLKCLVELPGTQLSKKSPAELASFIETATAFTMPQTVNIRLFSEALVNAHATGEVDADIAGGLIFSKQWIGLVEAIKFMCDEAAFQFDQQKAA